MAAARDHRLLWQERQTRNLHLWLSLLTQRFRVLLKAESYLDVAPKCGTAPRIT